VALREISVAKTDWQDADGNVTAVETASGRYGTIYTVSFNYKVGEHWYGGVSTGNDEYKVGDSIGVRYDPKDPDRNDQSLKDSRAKWIVAAVIAGIILVIVLVQLL
jgi:hypothetical protein